PILVSIISYLRIQVSFFLFFFGFIQHGIPAFTVPQPEEAMHVLEETASKLNVSCIVNALGSYIFTNWKMLAVKISSKLQGASNLNVSCMVNALGSSIFTNWKMLAVKISSKLQGLAGGVIVK